MAHTCQHHGFPLVIKRHNKGQFCQNINKSQSLPALCCFSSPPLSHKLPFTFSYFFSPFFSINIFLPQRSLAGKQNSRRKLPVLSLVFSTEKITQEERNSKATKMESEFQQHHFLLHDHQHQRQRNSGLIRYQSAPSSYFSSFENRESIEEFLDRPTSPETERILSGFLQTTDTSNNVDSFLHHTFSRQNSGGTTTEKKTPEVKTEEEEEIDVPATAMEVVGDVEIPVASESIPRNLGQNKRPREKDDRAPPANNLARHNSSPAGLFSSIDVETGSRNLLPLGKLSNFEKLI